MKNDILLIDDDTEFIHFYTQLLSSNYIVHAASSLKESLSYLEKNPFQPDLILCDIFMPDANGFEIYDYFKSQEKFEHLNIVFKTSSLNKGVAEESIINRGAELLSTYMSNEEFLARVSKSISTSPVLKFSNQGEVKLVLNKHSRIVLYPRNGQLIDFTETETKILSCLVERQEPVSRDLLLERAFRKGVVITDNNFNTTLTNLRKKLIPLNIKLVTKRNVGTQICC